MNKDLLFQLYSIHSPSGSEKKMRRFLRKMAAACGATSMETDKAGNLLIVKGEAATYPCLAAHMDQVQKAHSKDFMVTDIGGDVIGWSPKCHEQQGLGADDKNGIFICLELLKKYDVMKVAFFVGEETGCVGSEAVDLSFFKDCRFIIQPDRRGGSDLITSMFCGEVCSEDFINAIGYEQYGYEKEHGSITDVGTLVERGVGISCLNLSCGYYNAHSDEEITVLSELENCMNFVDHIVETCTDVYPFEGGYGGYYGGWYLHGKSYGTHWYDRVCSKESSSDKKSSVYPTQTGQGSQYDYSVYDDYDYYYDSGEYDQDKETMNMLLGIDINLSMESIFKDYRSDFNAIFTLGVTYGYDVLEDIYYEVLDALTYPDYEEKDSDDLSFDDVKIRKVS